jgi:hypothetical protein
MRARPTGSDPRQGWHPFGVGPGTAHDRVDVFTANRIGDASHDDGSGNRGHALVRPARIANGRKCDDQRYGRDDDIAHRAMQDRPHNCPRRFGAPQCIER